MTDLHKLSAKEDFRQARRQAALQQVLDGLRRQTEQLMPFDDVRQGLRAKSATDLGIQEISVDAIVGSVSRYEEYTRTFLPKYDSDEERWVRVKQQIDKSGLKPISVYKIGEVYFVNDGNHRVSVARQMGSKTMPAFVTEIKARVELSANDNPHEIICKARYTDFLEKTDLDTLRPGADLLMTFPGQYRILLEQIDTQRFILDLNPTREDVLYEEAVSAWYDRAYMPIVRLIRLQGLQRSFPDVTEADLYVMVIRHRDEMQRNLEWHVDLTAVTSDLIRQKSRARGQVADRVGDRLMDAVTPDALESGPAPGKWRQERIARRPGANPFSDILVAIRGTKEDRVVTKHAAIFAGREKARLMALQVVDDPSGRDSVSVQNARSQFKYICQESGIRGEFAVESGRLARKVVERVAWTDLLTLGLVRLSDEKTATGFGSEFNRILQRSPRPVLIVPENADSPMDKALLAYDGSAKSDEALYVAAYMAKNWGTTLVVVAAGEELAETALLRAQAYLSLRDVEGLYVSGQRPAYRSILATASEHDINFIIMGGYGYRPIMQLVLGSTVTKVLRRSDSPTLVCR